MMRTSRSWKRAARGLTVVVAVAAVLAACGSSDSEGSGSGGGDSSSGAPSSGGIADAQATVDKFAANPPLVVPPLPAKPATDTVAIGVNCTIPACAPGALKPAMAALGWSYDEMTYDLAKGPSDLKRAVVAAIAAKPDVILVSPNFPEATIQAEVDAAVKDGIKFIEIGGTLAPNYSACIQCSKSLEQLGSLAADIALADAGGKTEIAVTIDKTIAPLVSEAKGVKDQVAKNGEGSKVLEVEQSVSATPQDNSTRLVSFLQRNPNVKYLVTTQQFASATALKSAGLGSRVKIIGMYPLSASDVAAVKSGDVLAYATGEFGSLYWRATDAAARAVQDAPFDPIDPIQSLRIMNKSNADEALLDPADYENLYKKAWQG